MGGGVEPGRTLLLFFTLTMQRFLQFWLVFVLLPLGTTNAQEECGAEVKLLLLPSQVQSAVRSLNPGKAEPGHVYFFDTATLDLLSQGIIVRIRHGSTNDLTVKLRLESDKQMGDVSSRTEKYKCEIDLTGGTTQHSYSISRNFIADVPETGNALFVVLSPSQKHLLERAQAPIDWTRVKRIATINSTDWIIPKQRSFPKLSLEFWEWPTDSVLELSAKAASDDAAAVLLGLQQLAASKGLSSSKIQKSKTALVLEDITHVSADK
jgi:hypothetical protein